MLALIYFTASQLIASKLLDCISTLRKLAHYSAEQNVFLRRMMERWGNSTIIWLVFMLTVIIVAITTVAAVLMIDTFYYPQAFIITGLLISIVQYGVAVANFTGRDNTITRRIRAWGTSLYR